MTIYREMRVYHRMMEIILTCLWMKLAVFVSSFMMALRIMV